MMFYFPCDHFVENSAESYMSNHRVVQRKSLKLAGKREEASAVHSQMGPCESSDLESVCLDDEVFTSDKRFYKIRC